MVQSTIEPHKVTKPIALLAAWFVALVFIVSIFLGAAKIIDEPRWLKQFLVISAAVFVPLFLCMVYRLQTKYRPEMQEDPYYAEYLKRLGPVFYQFKPENIGTAKQTEVTIPPSSDESWEEKEKRRCKIYQDQRGLFLVHSWRPSKIPGQVADIVVSLNQHGNGPLAEGKVKSVEYQLGPKFFEHPVIKTNAKENFRLEVSAYGPMLCLAKVNFKDGSKPLELQRYVNF